MKLFIKNEKRLIRVNTEDVCFIEPKGDYVAIVFKSKNRIIAHSTMKRIAKKLPPEFIRIHNSCIVNIKHVSEIESDCLTVNGDFVNISRAGKANLASKIIVL